MGEWLTLGGCHCLVHHLSELAVHLHLRTGEVVGLLDVLVHATLAVLHAEDFHLQCHQLGLHVKPANLGGGGKHHCLLPFSASPFRGRR